MLSACTNWRRLLMHGAHRRIIRNNYIYLSIYLSELIVHVWSAAFMFCLDVKPSGFCYRPKIALLFTPPPPTHPSPSLHRPPPVIAIKSLVFLLRLLHGFIHKVLFTSPAPLPPSFVRTALCRPVKRRLRMNNGKSN